VWHNTAASVPVLRVYISACVACAGGFGVRPRYCHRDEDSGMGLDQEKGGSQGWRHFGFVLIVDLYYWTVSGAVVRFVFVFSRI
jgi:hypothetical protein